MIEAIHAPDPRSSAAGQSILLVDDDEDVRALMLDFLNQCGFRTLGAARGEQALEILARRDPVALVVTDVRMPGMSGIELMERITADYPEVKVVLVSGYFVPQPVRARFLRKPFRLAELLDVIREMTGMTGETG